jgi:hypothetical protein
LDLHGDRARGARDLLKARLEAVKTMMELGETDFHGRRVKELRRIQDLQHGGADEFGDPEVADISAAVLDSSKFFVAETETEAHFWPRMYHE